MTNQYPLKNHANSIRLEALSLAERIGRELSLPES